MVSSTDRADIDSIEQLKDVHDGKEPTAADHHVGHDESPETIDEHWRTTPDEPVEGRELFSIRTVEPDYDPRERVLQSSEVANDSRYTEYEMVSPRRLQLDDHEREVRHHVRVAEHYQLQAEQHATFIQIQLY